MSTPEDTELWNHLEQFRNGKYSITKMTNLITLHTNKAVDNKMASFGLKKGVKYKVMSTDKITVLEPQLTNPTEREA